MSLSRCTETAEIPLPDLPSDSEYWTKVSYSVGYNYTSRYLQGYWQKASKWIKFSTIQHITWRTHKKLSYKVWLKAEGTYLKTLWWWERDWVNIRDCLQAVWLISLITSVKIILKILNLINACANLTHMRSLWVINVLYNSDSVGVLTLSLWSLTLQPLEAFRAKSKKERSNKYWYKLEKVAETLMPILHNKGTLP